MDFLSLIDNPWDWVILFSSAVMLGMSKAGVQVSMLTVPLMAIAFGPKPSTGLVLPMLCIADVIAVSYYHRSAEWKYIFKLLPMAIIGFFVAISVDKFIPADKFRLLMAACLFFVLIVMVWSDLGGKTNALVEKWWYCPLFGLLGGFTTMIGNAAGPVMAIFLLSIKLPKNSFVGTSAWFFLVVNFLKIPLQLFVWHNISIATFTLDLCAIPFILIGAVIGISLVKKMSEVFYRRFITIVTIIAVIIMVI